MQEHLKRTIEQQKVAVSTMQKEVEKLKATYEAAEADYRRLHLESILSPAPEKVATASSKKNDALSNLIESEIVVEKLQSDEFMYNDLPEGVAVAKTDADDKFSMQLPQTGMFAPGARSFRQAGNKTETYLWLVKVPPRRFTIRDASHAQ